MNDEDLYYICRRGTNIRAVAHDKEPVIFEIGQVNASEVMQWYGQVMRCQVEAVRLDTYHQRYTAAVARAVLAATRGAEEIPA